MLALFTYGFTVADQAFKAANISLQTLCDYENLLPVAIAQNKISLKQSENLKKWREDPSQWKPSQG